jgi:hypothetical protein
MLLSTIFHLQPANKLTSNIPNRTGCSGEWDRLQKEADVHNRSNANQGTASETTGLFLGPSETMRLEALREFSLDAIHTSFKGL